MVILVWLPIHKYFEFRDKRNWAQFHNPKDLALGLSLEAAELTAPPNILTSEYLKSDVPALTIEGRKIWGPRKTLEKFAVAHLAIPPAKAREIIDRVVDAVDGVRNEVRRYMADHPGFVPVGEGMLAAWRAGVDGLSTHRPA